VETEPGRIARLQHDKHHRPVPWFVAWIDGEPDFRILRPGAVGIALASRCCWVCGMLMTKHSPQAFTVGPMCAVNRVSAEPPADYDCAVYSAKHCPFLTTPNMERRQRHLPAGTADPPGVMIRRNPGVALVWVTKPKLWRYRGGLFDIGEPQWVEWFARGRPASRAEALESMDSGMPILHEAAHNDDDPRKACEQLDRQYVTACGLLPA
jgi:hypothetical protein